MQPTQKTARLICGVEYVEKVYLLRSNLAKIPYGRITEKWRIDYDKRANSSVLWIQDDYTLIFKVV